MQLGRIVPDVVEVKLPWLQLSTEEWWQLNTQQKLAVSYSSIHTINYALVQYWMMSLPQVCKYTKDSIDGVLPALARDISTLHSADLASLAPTQHLTDVR